MVLVYIHKPKINITISNIQICTKYSPNSCKIHIVDYWNYIEFMLEFIEFHSNLSLLLYNFTSDLQKYIAKISKSVSDIKFKCNLYRIAAFVHILWIGNQHQFRIVLFIFIYCTAIYCIHHKFWQIYTTFCEFCEISCNISNLKNVYSVPDEI